MSDIFPYIQPQAITAAADAPPEIYRDVEWDYTADAPVFVRGEPKIAAGLPAVMSWAWRALKVERYLHEAYSWDYGDELMGLIGQPWEADTKLAEAERYTRECLLANPYVTAVEDIAVSFADGMLSVACTLTTPYGAGRLEIKNV